MIQFNVGYNPAYGCYDIYAFNRNGDKHFLGKPIEFTEVVEKYERPSGPTAVLDKLSAQALIDELWRAGVRPSNGEGSVGEIAAVRNHLADMQNLVFNHNVNGKKKLQGGE
jgi:hypothetical protein